MLKVLIDTNVLVSASIANGPSYKIFKEIIIEKELALLCYSEAIFEEYQKVAHYKRIQTKYPAYFEAINNYLSKIKKAGKLFYPTVHFDIISTDISDNIFLDAAYAANADYIITGNHNDFGLAEFETTKIISPKRFYELYEQNKL
jgi:putative PIN family toxin of toxin-antitoxin system